MPFHWQSHVNVQAVGVEDMVLLRSLTDDSIVDNLRKRLAAKAIFTYIGPVLISVNPFKELPYFTEKEMQLYQGSAQYENPPHIFALADEMYRSMMIDGERQCSIISGESGAGKTVSAKFIMSYVAKISGGGARVQHLKDVIVKSNPLLESFGNAATLRNWNSSRFGKYVEIIFGRGGEPIGGRISNFLLEKSRVASLSAGERNFHIFYQLIAGADTHTRENLGISTADYYNYLNQSGCYKAAGTDDAHEYAETLQAMKTVGISDADQLHILRLVSAILHIGNISFVEQRNYASVLSDDYLQFPAYLLGLTAEAIKEKVTKRRLESKWGRDTEQIDVQLNVEQAVYTRDAWVKVLYSRLFDYLVESVNKALRNNAADASEMSIGILDIYGFEIFEKNGFEQFCINFVNEKLQQIFIQLTLRAEQEEYMSEGIKWTPIDYFDNRVVCELIEAKKPPGIMCLLDDICAQIHGQSEGVDAKFLVKLSQQVARHEHFRSGAQCFIVTHYAGEVTYQVDGFCDRNRDVLYPDLIQLMKSSDNEFMSALFPESLSNGTKTKPTSVSTKIKTQANQLVDSLMKCTPHYVRCIKPNETKAALQFDAQRVLHQVRYLGLKENIRVRRAGFAYRRAFEKFLWRYAILCAETWPHFAGEPRRGCEMICRSAQLAPDQFQLGKSKVFIKNPESLFLLEESRERKYDGFARVIQKAFRKFTASKYHIRQKKEASDLLFGRKERRRCSLNRNFVGDYIGVESNHPALQVIVGRREKINFAHTVNKYDRSFKASKLDLLVTSKHVTMVGRQVEKAGVNKGKLVEVVKRQISLEKIQAVGLSPYQDDFILIYVQDDYTSLLETPLKTEFLSALSKRYKERNGKQLQLDFKTSYAIRLKKTRYDIFGGPGTRQIQFCAVRGDCHTEANNNNGSHLRYTLKAAGKVLMVEVAPGLPSNSTPSTEAAHSTISAASKAHSSARQLLAARQQQQQQKEEVHHYQQPQLSGSAMNGRVGGGAAHSTHHQAALLNALSKQNAVHPVRHAPLVTNGDSANETPPPLAARPRLAPKPKPKGPQVKTLYPYEAQDTDELSFQEGQIIELLQKDECGWWQGRIGAKTGVFPSNYVEELLR